MALTNLSVAEEALSLSPVERAELAFRADLLNEETKYREISERLASAFRERVAGHDTRSDPLARR